MPVFNAGVHLRPAVWSILQQSWCDWELLLLDDGSDDGAIEALSELDDARIRILRDGRNTGIAVRLNQALALARGQFFARMDADDIAHPDRFALQIAMLQGDAGLDLVATRAVLIDEADQIGGEFPSALSHQKICEHPWRGFHFPHPTWMGRTAWFRAHRYAVPAPYLCEDQELLLRSYTTSRFATVDALLLAYRLKGAPQRRQLASIRRATLAYQLHHFLRRHQWRFAALAMFAWLAKSCRDAARRWTASSGPIDEVAMPADMVERWRTVLNTVNASSRAGQG